MTEQAQSPARCDAEAGVNGEPLCGGEQIRHSVFRTPESTTWDDANWCDEHRRTAIADGYRVYTWLTHIVCQCRSCECPFYPSQEAVDTMRETTEQSDDEIARGFDLCLACVDLDVIPGEHPDTASEAAMRRQYAKNLTQLRQMLAEAERVAPKTYRGFTVAALRNRVALYERLVLRPAREWATLRGEPVDPPSWQIRDLTARDVLALEAALEVAADPSEEEPYPGLFDVQRKVKRAADAARACGFTVAPETSAQSQAYIDGEKPWPPHDEDEGSECPVGDLDCLSRDDESHDACEAPATKRVREASTFEVFGRPSNESHGVFDTFDAALGCVEFDRLKDYEIWQGDHIVAEQADDEADKWLDAVVTPTEPTSGD